MEDTVQAQLTISRLKKELRELKQRNELFRQIGESVDHVIWIAEWPELKLEFLSRGYEKIWGQLREQVYENPYAWQGSIHPEDRERVAASFQKNVENGTYEEQYRVLRPDGTIRWIRDRGFPVRDEHEHVHRVAGIAEDITERKELEQQLAHVSSNIERFFLDHDIASTRVEPWVRLVYDATPDFYVSLALDGTLVDLNRSAVEALGYERVDLLGQKLQTFIAPESRDSLRALLENHDDEIEPSEEWVFVTADGSMLETELRAGRHRSSEGSDVHCFLVLRDITRNKRLARHLMQTEKLATTGRLAASVAHEINNPLQALQLHMSIVSQRLPADFAEIESWHRIEEGVERISHVVGDLLDLHRVGRRSPQEVQINDLAREALGLAGSKFRRQEIRVVQNLEPELPAVHGITHQLYQVILNLLVNGAEALGHGGTLSVTTRSESGRVIVEVEDDGPGIPAGELHQIFDPLFVSRNSRGTGLGLFVSRTLVQEHNGTLDLVSEEGRGTRVTASLPAAHG